MSRNQKFINEDKSGLIQTVIDSGRVKFMYYVYEYVLGLTEGERKDLGAVL